MKHWVSGVVNQRQRGEEGRPPFKSISENVTGLVEKGLALLVSFLLLLLCRIIGCNLFKIICLEINNFPPFMQIYHEFWNNFQEIYSLKRKS